MTEQETQEEAPIDFENIDELFEHLQTIRQENVERIQSIHQSGGVLDPITIIMTRIDTFMEFMPPETRVQIEYVFERKMESWLKDQLSEATRKKLAPETQNTLYVPGS